MSGYRIVQDYPHPPALVWRALTDPDLVPRWTATGQGARPVGFAPVPGTRFQYVGRPTIGWSGVVDCEVLAVEAPSLLAFTWIGEDKGDVTKVTCSLAAVPGGTRLTWSHDGFTGLGGFIVSRILASVRRKMLAVGMAALLTELDAPALERT